LLETRNKPYINTLAKIVLIKNWKNKKMKKIILIALILFTSITFAQEKIGILAGINANQTNTGFLTGLRNFGFGYHIGAVYNFEITENVSFSPKILYSKQGDTSENEKTFFSGEYSWGTGGLDYELSYLNIPLNFKFFNKTYILFGPQVGILLKTEKLNLDFGDVKNKIDLGINLGIGQKINNFFVELNVNQGFSTIIEFNDNSKNSENEKNLVAQLTLGYYFK
jgi:hypothetical protein